MEQYNGVELAFLGDCYYELLLRQKVLSCGEYAKNFQRSASRFACAAFQSAAFAAIEAELEPWEIDVYKRGRNTKGSVPKSATVAQYRTATGLEALFGGLFLEKKTARAEYLFEKIWDMRYDLSEE